MTISQFPNQLIPIPFTLESAALIQSAHVQVDDAADFEALVGHARQMGQPKVLYTEVYVEITGAETVALGGVTFTSVLLRQNLENVERVFPFVVTCGREMDAMDIPPTDFLRRFWWDQIKESLLHSAFQTLSEHLTHTYRLPKIATMSPGSGDVDVWPIEQQRQLFSLLGDVNQQIGVELTDSYLMIPNKTVSGICFPTEKDFRTCQVCRRENCPSRGAPLNQEMWDALHS